MIVTNRGLRTPVESDLCKIVFILYVADTYMFKHIYETFNGRSYKLCIARIDEPQRCICILHPVDKQNFFQDVYEVAKLIPRGRVTSYGAIAAFLGAKSGARMVGWAMNGAGVDPSIPAHRVVNHKGLLTGKHHFSDSE